MPTYAENLIGSVTVGSGGSSSIDFTNIPQTYTDLKIVLSTRDSRSSNGPGYLKLSINGSTSNFSYKSLFGYSTGPGDPNPSGTPAAGSDSGSGASGNYASYAGGTNAQTANTFGNNEIYIPNYTSSNYKSISVDGVNETNGTYPFQVHLVSSLWSNTAAITSLSITPGSSPFVQYTTAYLYGITNANPSGATGSVPKATGGTISYSSGYWYHTFETTGTFAPTSTITNADVLIVGGGGAGGGGYSSGGGGAGGYIATTNTFSVGSYTATVGGAGSSSSFISQTASAGNNGGNPSGGSSGAPTTHSGGGGVSSKGGGGGGGSTGNGTAGGTNNNNGIDGIPGYGGAGTTWLNGVTYATGGAGTSNWAGDGGGDNSGGKTGDGANARFSASRNGQQGVIIVRYSA